MPAIDKLVISGFKAFPNEFQLEFNGRNLLLYGENGSGKSSIYYALHCIFQSPLKKDAGKKYFNETNADGTTNQQHLKNINTLLEDAKIRISFTDNHPFLYEVNKNGYNTTLVDGTHPLPADITGVFVNHKFLFEFFNFRNSEKINLFTVFAKDIFPFVKDERSGLHLGEMYDQLTTSISKHGRRLTQTAQNNIIAFNQLVRNLVEEINTHASDVYNTYFRNDEESSLEIKLRYDSNEEKPADDPNEYWLKYDYGIEYAVENGVVVEKRAPYKRYNKPFIGMEITEISSEGARRRIYNPQSFFNEAKLTAVALSIRFALLNLDKPADGRFLALDDMLISLDMSNRTKVVNFLISISDKYKIYLFTHDRAFFELTKEIILSKINAAKEIWLFKELYYNENALENPVCLPSDDAYTRAISHFKKFDYPAAANYLRKAVEELMNIFPRYISINNDGSTKEKLRAKIDAAKNIIVNTDGDINDINQIILSLGTLLNPLSHRSIDTNIYRTELEQVIKTIPRLKQHIIDLEIKEVVAVENDVYLCLDENETTSCKIKIKLKTPLYSYMNKNGQRTLSVAEGNSIESVTIKNGIEEGPKQFTYFINLPLEECCKRLFAQIGKDYTGNYVDFYKNAQMIELNTLL